jgi:RNA binding exosome subunit
MKPGLDSAELSFYLHATEDEEKVLRAVCNLLQISRDSLERRRLEGHFGNVILSFTSVLKGEDASNLWKIVMQSLNSVDKEDIRRNFSERLENGKHFHIRLSKQAMVLGQVRLGESDPVKLEFRFSKFPVTEEILDDPF